MTTDFAFKVSGDATQAHSANEKVLDQLDRIEAEARQAGQALSSSFSSAGTAISKIAADARQSADAQKTMAQRMRGVADELANQERMYQRIHGPAQRYAADLKALDALLHQNQISAAQYADQVTRMNRAIEGTPKAARSGAIAPPSSSGPSPGAMLGGVRMGAAALGIGLGASELIEIADGYTNIQNRLRLLTGDQARANQLYRDLGNVAQATRSDLSATVDAYAGMSRATKALGLSQAQTVRLTQTLNSLVATSGKSASESAAGLMQFSQALSSGRLQGDELRSVFENMPSLVDALMKSLGKTQAELRAMGSAGEITSKVMVDALMGASDAADRGLAQSIPTIGQSLTKLKNTITMEAGPALASLAQKLGEIGSGIANIVGTPLGLLRDGFSALNDIGVDFGAGTMIGFIMGGPLGAAVGTAIETLGDYIGAWDSVVDVQMRAIEVEDMFAKRRGEYVLALMQGTEQLNKWYEAQVDMNLALTLGAEAAAAFKNAMAGTPAATGAGLVGQYTPQRLKVEEEAKKATASMTKEVDEYAKALAGIKGPQEDAIRQINILNNLHMNGAISYDEMWRAAKQYYDLLDERGFFGDPKSVASPLGAPVDYTAGIDTGALTQGYIKAAAYDHDLLTKSWMERMEAIQQANRDFANSFAPIGDAIQEAFMRGEASLESLDNALRNVAFNMFKFMAMQAASSLGGANAGFAGSILSGIFGGSPGMAHGGVVYQGAGGTDSQIYAIRKSPNEIATTTVETPGQHAARMAGGSSGGGMPALSFHLMNDRRDMVEGMNSSYGRTVAIEINREIRRMRKD